MDFREKIKALGDRVAQLKDNIKTEEATKNAFVLPFIQALGYDVFNPLEVIPEYIADLGIKKGEKIDYCIVKDGNPIIIIECKNWKEDLSDHSNQLHRYFYATSTKFAILTNGIKYQFYTDSEQTNKMDSDPFLEFEINAMTTQDIEQLEKFQKENFNNSEIFNTANDQKISRQVMQRIEKEFQSPSDGFVKFFAKEIHKGALTKRVIAQYMRIIKTTLNQILSEPTQDKSETDIPSPTNESKELKRKTTALTDGKLSKPDKIKISGDSYPISKSFQILTTTAEWLIRNNSLRQKNCPIQTGRSKLYLVNTTPKNRDNEDFRSPKRLSNGLYIETSFSKIEGTRQARKLLESCGHQGSILEV